MRLYFFLLYIPLALTYRTIIESWTRAWLTQMLLFPVIFFNDKIDWSYDKLLKVESMQSNKDGNDSDDFM